MSSQEYKETITRITHVEYWKNIQRNRCIQCSHLVHGIRCTLNSIGSYLEVYEEKEKEYAKSELLFFCDIHIPEIVETAIKVMKTTVKQLSQERNTV